MSPREIPSFNTQLLAFLLIQIPLANSFQPIFSRASTSSYRPRNIFLERRIGCILRAKSQDEGDDGMSEAFKSLNELTSLDFDDVREDRKKTETNIKADSDLLKDVREINANSSSSETATESEAKIYTDMQQELETEGEDGMYNDILGELTESESSTGSNAGVGFGKSTSSSKVVKDEDGIGSLSQQDDEAILAAVDISSQNTDEFMKKALEEAMQEVNDKNPNPGAGAKDALPENILNDKEVMNEINAIFDRANDKLMAGIADIREEQAALTEESAKVRSDSLKSEEQRLAEAEGSVSRLVGKVKEETLEVENAVADLKKAQEELLQDPLMKAVDLKSGGMVKQGALVGTLLFSFRSLGELLLMSGPNGADHGVAAVVQGVIAVACAAYFFLA